MRFLANPMTPAPIAEQISSRPTFTPALICIHSWRRRDCCCLSLSRSRTATELRQPLFCWFISLFREKTTTLTPLCFLDRVCSAHSWKPWLPMVDTNPMRWKITSARLCQRLLSGHFFSGGELATKELLQNSKLILLETLFLWHYILQINNPA